ncbi:hypothetical protein F4Z99_19215 [Candidatus Poribacteria bacterium]|nr:hypothetical protein [Candidatus Poribacteria bacterium]
MAFLNNNRKYCIAFVILIIVISVAVTYKIVTAEVTWVTFQPRSDHSNPFSFGNGESVDISIVWSKDVQGFELEDLAFTVTDNDGNSITEELRQEPSIKLPKINNFIEIDKRHYRVTLTGPYQYWGRIQSGNILFSFARKDNSIIGEPFDHEVMLFTWGKKAKCWLYSSKRHLKNGESTGIAIFWDRNVRGFTIDDLSSDKGELSDLNGDWSFMEVTLKAPDTGTGKIKVTLNEDACVEGNNSEIAYVTYGSE